MPDGDHTLADDSGRWPVLAGIPYLRTGREALRAYVLDALDDGDEHAALVALLRDQDDWAPGPPPDAVAVTAALEPGLGLRETMRRLGFGAVGDYFAFRWSDPTYLSGLGLLGAHTNPGATVLELGCGIGAYLRALAPLGRGTIGLDVVWAKLWLARRFVAPEARLVCVDAAAGLPLEDGAADVAFCHDAFYFLAEKALVARELARTAGTVLVGHAHNRLAENLSAGAPLAPAEYAALFASPVLYDDVELSTALLADRVPRCAPASALTTAAAVAIAAGPGIGAPHTAGAHVLPPAGTPLRLNPLLAPPARGEDPVRLRVKWPTARYEAEYAPFSGYLTDPPVASRDALDRAARGAVGSDPEVDALARRRVVVDLPEAW